MTDAPLLTWVDEHRLRVDDQAYLIDSDQVFRSTPSTPEQLVVIKGKDMLERFWSRHPIGSARNVFEIGIFKGGSAALFHQTLRPQKLVAVDIESERVAALDDFIARNQMQASLRPYYSVDQADKAALTSILDDEFAREPLDLVIDDASHQYAPSRATFEAVFPRLREGGTYILEDWSWAHYNVPRWQDNGGVWPTASALTNLVVEIMVMSGGFPQIAPTLLLDRGVLEVTRGPAELPAPFSLSEKYLNRGRPFQPIL